MNRYARTLLMTFCMVFYCNICLSQLVGKEMLVPQISQKSDTWCWAACIEMIMKFHLPNSPKDLSQKQAILKLAAINKWSNLLECTDCAGTMNYMLGAGSTSSACYFPIKFSTEAAMEMDYLDRVFSSFNFQSRQLVNFSTAPIKWWQITKQIDECHPFIIFVDPADRTGDHALVAKGYYEDQTTSVKYISTNDPWNTCTTAAETVFPVSVLGAPMGASSGNIEVDRVWAAVMDISPDSIFTNSGGDCQSCATLNLIYGGLSPTRSFMTTDITSTSAPRLIDERIGRGPAASFYDTSTINEAPRLMVALNKNRAKVIGFDQNKIESQKLEQHLNEKDYYGAPVKFLAFDKLSRFHLCRPKKLENGLAHREEVMDVVSAAAGKQIVSTLQKQKDGQWELRKISNFTNVVDQLILNDSSLGKITLSNLKGNYTIQNAIPYVLIKFTPFNCEFYSFTYKDNKYFSPAADYVNYNFFQGAVLSERDVMKSLGQIAFQYKTTSRKDDLIQKGLFRVRGKAGTYTKLTEPIIIGKPKKVK